MAKCTAAAFEQAKKLRTRYPWAVARPDGVLIGVFNYRDDAKAFARQFPNDAVAFDATGATFELVGQ